VPVRAQLDRILASGHFSRSPALSRLLQFIVGLTLEGKEQELKEYRLGVDVFDRGADFDPRVDPIVRMQAAKLRARLAEYYAADGRYDPVVISIPKGGYIPGFRQAAPALASPAIEVKSIAVLPFVSMSADPENEYFADGLTEELINVLTQVPGLRVVARTTVFCFKNAAADVREIGAKLKVESVLEGSVRKSGNQLRVTAQLIDVASGFHLLSRAYPRELKDVFAVQEELANAVITEIMPQVRKASIEPVRVSTGDLGAYALHLKGMCALPRGHSGPRESAELFKQALAIDPRYAPASAGLAWAYFLMAWYSSMPVREAMSLGKAAAQNAIRLDPSVALGHAALGAVLGAFEWKWREAEESFQRAISLQPGLAVVHQLYAGTCLLPQKRVSDATAAIDRALASNPFDPMVASTAVYTYSIGGNYEAALQTYSLGVEVNPKSPLLYRAMGLAHQVAGHMDKAVKDFQTACDAAGRSPVALAALGQALARSGDREGAQAILRELESSKGRTALAMAYMTMGLNRPEESLGWLEKAADEPEPHLMMIPVHPVFDPLREHRRFHQLMQRMHLEQP
jgi:adenylate cyclase